MYLVIRAATWGCIGAACVALGCSPAIAGGQVVLGVGPPAPVFIPPPNSIPAPLPLPPQANGAGIAPVQPLPPLILYSSPPVVLPFAPHERSNHHNSARR